MIGMGSSSRPKNYYNNFTPQQSIQYFIEYFERWRKAMANEINDGEEFTDFYLVAHSFGGYLSGNYALKHHQHIRKLVLLSPVGIKPGNPNADPGED